MSIQYSGNAQTSTFTPTTKQNIIDTIGAALIAAGWTTASGGSGTTNWMLTSATTPQGYAINVRMKDNAGTCVTFSLESTDGVLVGGNSTTVAGGWLIPNAGYTYRIVCNKYQAFIFATPNLSSVGRAFVAFGVPFLNSWLTSGASRVGWMQGGGLSDTNTAIGVIFRQSLFSPSSFSVTNQAIYNATIWTVNGAAPGTGTVAVPSYVATVANQSATGYRWQNNSALLIDALIGWGDTAASAEGKFKGQLWDAVVSTDVYAGDSTATFDTHNWIAITDNNANTTGRGTLLIATS